MVKKTRSYADNEVASFVRNRMKSLGMKTGDVVAASGLSRFCVWTVSVGLRIPAERKTVEGLAKALDVEVEALAKLVKQAQAKRKELLA